MSESSTATAVAPPKQLHTRDNPFLARIVDKRPLTDPTSSKLTLHFSLSLKDGDIAYEPGDSCGVVAHNDPGLVADVLAAGKFGGEERVPLPNLVKAIDRSATDVSLHELFTHHLQITRLTRKLVTAFANKGEISGLQALLVPEKQDELEAYLYERGLIDLLEEYPGVFTDPSELVSVLPRLTPRLYSISSSPIAHVDEVHTTVAVVRYTSNHRERGGVCTTYMSDRTEVGDAMPVYIQPNKKFRLPLDPDTPIIMIGPGTGVAPFRSFLHERRMLGAKGHNWLFFGERSAATDYLYREEFEAMRADGHLTRLDLAFSRDQEKKIYVQDRMREQAAEFWRWLDRGASVYVCGDATRMAKDVDAMLRKIIASQGGMSAEAADAYVHDLNKAHRYHRDVY